jgi:hypothetical protein
LVLGRSKCALFDSSGSEVVRFDRKMAEDAIKLPGFTRSEHLGIAKEISSFSADPGPGTRAQLLSELRSIRGAKDRGVPYYWFFPDKRMIPILERYLGETPPAVGGEAVAWGAEPGDQHLADRSDRIGHRTGLTPFLTPFPKAVMRRQ